MEKTTEDFDITFKPSGRGAARCPADPAFPDGVTMNAQTGPGPSCIIVFPYPAPECGMFLARCRRCGFRIGVTAAGRADDPRAVQVSCLPRGDLN